MQLTEHFSLEEFTASETAARLGIDNYPGTNAYENLKLLAVAMEEVRKLLGHPIHINSAYRCPALNSAVHSRPTSAHVDGLAADFTCAAFGSPVEVCRAIAASTIQYDQIIHEFSAWTHLAIAHKGLIGRREMLTIDRTGTRFGLEK